MKTKIYNNFIDNDGNQYGFDNYADFSAWWFAIPLRRAKLAFSPQTFSKLSRAATQSKEARARIYKPRTEADQWENPTRSI